MQNNSRKRKIVSPLSLTYQPPKLAKIETIEPKFNKLSSISHEENLTQSKIKTFSECSPATINYLKHHWGSDHDKKNNTIYCSKNISNLSGNTNDTVVDKKIKYIPDCSPMTQNMIANHHVEYFEPEDEINLLTCSIDSNPTTQKLKVANNMQSFSLSGDFNEDVQYLKQEKNKENVQFYFDSNISKALSPSSKWLCSASSNLFVNDSDKETLLLSGISLLSASQQSFLEDNKLNLNESYSHERCEAELERTYLLSNVCSEYDEHEDKMLCTPKITTANHKNNLKTMNIDEIQQLIFQNIAFLKMNFVQ